MQKRTEAVKRAARKGSQTYAAKMKAKGYKRIAIWLRDEWREEFLIQARKKRILYEMPSMQEPK